MPASPADGEQYAAKVVEIVDDLEAGLLALIRDALKTDPTSPQWEARRLAELQRIRATAQRDSRLAIADLERTITDLVLHAWNHGAALALNDVEALGQNADMARGRDAYRSAELIAHAAVVKIRDVERVLPRLLSSAYQEAVAAGGLEVLGGTSTRLQASQHVLDRLLSDGVRGFTDKAGRAWSLESYVEMATRTVTGQAAVDGYVDQLQGKGLDLVVVSDSPRECPLCRPWEGKVLSISGQVGAVIAPDAATGEATTVKVAGTVSQARAAGLQHPNCTHRLTAYLPGLTLEQPGRGNADGYEAKQRQREIERHIRRWKRREQLALTPEAASVARSKVRAWQGALRDHVDEHALKRQRHREQIGTAAAPLAR